MQVQFVGSLLLALECAYQFSILVYLNSPFVSTVLRLDHFARLVIGAVCHVPEVVFLGRGNCQLVSIKLRPTAKFKPLYDLFSLFWGLVNCGHDNIPAMIQQRYYSGVYDCIVYHIIPSNCRGCRPLGVEPRKPVGRVVRGEVVHRSTHLISFRYAYRLYRPSPRTTGIIYPSP